MMDRPFQLRWSLVTWIVHTIRKVNFQGKHQKACQSLCRRNPLTVFIRVKFKFWQSTPVPGKVHPCVMMTLPNRRTQTTALAVSSGKLRVHGPQITGLPYKRSGIFQKWWRALEYRPHLVRGLRTDLCCSAGSKKTLCACARQHASSKSSTSSYPHNGNTAETSSEDEDVDVDKTNSQKGMSYLEARRQGLLSGRRSLSPTERMNRMMRADCDSGGSRMGQGTDWGVIIPPNKSELSTGLSRDRGKITGKVSPTAASNVSPRSVGGGGVVPVKPAGFPDDPPMVDCEMVIAVRENFKRHEYLYRMFLLNASNIFRSKFGVISHADVVGHLAGRTFTTDLGIDIMIRRPSLDEFVLYMKRTPVISYPKDCCTMLMMIDVNLGDVILEAGTGSGAMTLFLSRAVGPEGCIHTFEAKPEHINRAIKNVKQWGSSWNITHPGQPWPENVCFHSGKLESCDKELDSTLSVDGAVIDMERPHEAMPTLAARLKSGKAAVIYVANVTQIIEVAECLRVHSLPLSIEKTLEVGHKVWVVNQARRHSGISLGEARVSNGLESQPDQSDLKHEGSSTSVQYIKDYVPKYIARPHNEQHGHTAFLVKVRKIESASATYKL